MCDYVQSTSLKSINYKLFSYFSAGKSVLTIPVRFSRSFMIFEILYVMDSNPESKDSYPESLLTPSVFISILFLLKSQHIILQYNYQIFTRYLI